MKCPSKEIDKNNISLLLSNHKWFFSLFESPHSSCFVSSGCPVVFLQSMAVSCVSCWRVRVKRAGEEHSGLSSRPPPPSTSTSTPVLFGSVGLRGRSLQSLPLRLWGCDVRVAALGPSASSAVGERPPPAQRETAVGRSLLPARAMWALASEHPGGAAESLVYLGQHQMRIYSRHPGPTGALDQQGRRGLSPPSG